MTFIRFEILQVVSLELSLAHSSLYLIYIYWWFISKPSLYVYLPDLKANELVSTAIQTAHDNLQTSTSNMNDEEKQNKPSYIVDSDLQLLEKQLHDEIDQFEYFDDLDDNTDNMNDENVISKGTIRSSLPRDLSVRNNYANSKFFNIDNGTIPEEEEEEHINDDESRIKSKQLFRILTVNENFFLLKIRIEIHKEHFKL